MTQTAPTMQTASLFAKQTFGVLDNPANPIVATFEFADGPPDTVSWDGHVYQHEDAGMNFSGPTTVVYYQLHPLAVSATPKGAAPTRLDQLQAFVPRFKTMLAELDTVQRSGPPDTSDGSHQLGKFVLFTSGNGVGMTNKDGTIVVPVGLLGLGQVYAFGLDKGSARQLAMAILNAGA